MINELTKKTNHKNLENVKILRLLKGYSQEYMAYKLGISQKSYSNIENGKTLLNDNLKNKISKILEIKPNTICPLCDNCIL